MIRRIYTKNYRYIAAGLFFIERNKEMWDWYTILFNPFVMTATFFTWYYVIRTCLFGSKPPDNIDWTEVDVFYHSKFVEHVDHCKECDPQDEPCELGQQMLDDWKVAKKEE